MPCLYSWKEMICFLDPNKWYRQAKVNSIARPNLDLVKMRVHPGNAGMLRFCARCSVFPWPHSPNLRMDSTWSQSKLLTFTQASTLELASPLSSGPALLDSSTAFTAEVSLCPPQWQRWPWASCLKAALGSDRNLHQFSAHHSSRGEERWGFKKGSWI